MIGIYKITNKFNKKCYIGQSINITQRWKEHRGRYQVQEYPLYRAIRKYGIKNFTFEVIEECPKELLDEREIYWIDYYDSTNPEKGYNLTSGGQNKAVHELTEEQIFKIYDLLRQEITQVKIAEQFNIAQSLVSAINTGVYYHQEEIEYPIVNTKKKKITYCIDCGKEINSEAERCIKCASLHRRKTDRPDRLTLKALIRTKPFTHIGKMYNVSDNAIRKWCIAYNLPSKKTVIEKIIDEEWASI